MVSRFLIFAGFLCLGLAEEQVADIQSCPEVPNNACLINEVRIDPCNVNKKCVLKKGSFGRMTVNYTPNFDATNAKFGLYWNNGVDVLYPDIESTNACNYTTCPIQAGQPQTLTYSLRIGKKVPKGIYLFKCKFWNEENENQTCCFRTTVQIRK